MEKLKAKHDHKLTDILKVGIFAIFLLLPLLTWLPSGLYYAFNEHALTESETIEKYETKQVNFNQQVEFFSSNNIYGVDVVSYDSYTSLNGVVTDINIYAQFPFTDTINFKRDNSQYYVKVSNNNGYTYGISGYGVNNSNSFIFQQNEDSSWIGQICLKLPEGTNISLNNLTAIVVDLTQMFGRGNEPTLQQFESLYTNEYYTHTESKLEIIDIPTGETTEYTNISNQLVYNWQSMWNSPLFYWTNISILNTGLTNFCNILGINTTAYITNLIAYELIMVAIYIVIDIVLTLFKWLTHLIGEK